LAIAGYTKNKIAVFNIDVDKLNDGRRITLTDAFELYSDQLNEPHGLDFLDEETVIVTNRSGDAIFVQLPSDKKGSNSFELAPLEIIHSGDGPRIFGDMSDLHKVFRLVAALEPGLSTAARSAVAFSQALSHSQRR
jgi:hypothetical protein